MWGDSVACSAGDGRVDFLVVGAGILGLATARQLLLSFPGKRVMVVDKESRIAAHQTGRSSGVIHSGVYYAPGSRKADLCVRGAHMLRELCAQRDIPVRECGKVIVAVSEAELPRLEELHRRALANGVVGAELIGPERLRVLEPHAAAVRALHVPSTGCRRVRTGGRSAREGDRSRRRRPRARLRGDVPSPRRRRCRGRDDGR